MGAALRKRVDQPHRSARLIPQLPLAPLGAHPIEVRLADPDRRIRLVRAGAAGSLGREFGVGGHQPTRGGIGESQAFRRTLARKGRAACRPAGTGALALLKARNFAAGLQGHRGPGVGAQRRERNQTAARLDKLVNDLWM